MFNIEIKKKKNVDVIDSRLLHKKLEVRSYHADWMRRRIDNYGFEEGKDYHSEMSVRSDGLPGKKAKTYLLTLDMAKELCMIENNEIGKITRRYFIQAEKQLRKHEVVRLATKQARRSLTDSVDESGENDRMKGHAYSTYTNLAYKLAGVDKDYKQFRSDQKIVDGYSRLSFRDVLSEKQLKRLEGIEILIRSMVDAEKQYLEIKESLPPLFVSKQ